MAISFFTPVIYVDLQEMTETTIKTVLNWSSGKDAALAYHLLLQSRTYKVTKLLTTVNAELTRVVMHGIREELLDAQAAAIGIPMKKIYLPAAPDDATYKNAMHQALSELKEEGIGASAFGDIFLEDLKAYREAQLATVGMEAVFPLWKQNTRELIGFLEETGIEAMVVCLNGALLDQSFLGRKIDRSFLNDLPASVDLCGENGEFHTFVYNAPYFKVPIPVAKGDITHKTYTTPDSAGSSAKTGFYFLDLYLDK